MAMANGQGDHDRGEAHPEGPAPHLLVALLGLLGLLVELLDAGHDRRVLGRGAGGVGFLVEVPFPVDHLLGQVPQATLLDAGQRLEVALLFGGRVEVVGLDSHLLLRLADVEAGPGEQVDGAVGTGEPGRDVLGGLHGDDPVAGPFGAEHGEAVARVGGHLEVDTRPAVAQRTDQLVDQAFAFELADAGDDGQPLVEVEAVGPRPRVDHESFE